MLGVSSCCGNCGWVRQFAQASHGHRAGCSCKGSIGFHNEPWFPMSPRETDDPQHWRNRAAKIRALALTVADPKVAILMTDLAVDYDELAERAAIKANLKKRSNGKSR
jgi:hypothetical protein